MGWEPQSGTGYRYRFACLPEPGPDDEGLETAMAVADFESYRKYLAGIAYRMLGSYAEAEDLGGSFLLTRSCQVSRLERL
jgi:hypothetical protein